MLHTCPTANKWQFLIFSITWVVKGVSGTLEFVWRARAWSCFRSTLHSWRSFPRERGWEETIAAQLLADAPTLISENSILKIILCTKRSNIRCKKLPTSSTHFSHCTNPPPRIAGIIGSSVPAMKMANPRSGIISIWTDFSTPGSLRGVLFPEVARDSENSPSSATRSTSWREKESKMRINRW